MPFVQCDIRKGRSKEQLSEFMHAIAKAVEDTTSIPADSVVVLIRETPGFNFLEFGEHCVDYEPDASGRDVAGEAQLRRLGQIA